MEGAERVGAGGPAPPSLSPVASILQGCVSFWESGRIQRLYFLEAFLGIAQLVFIGFLHVSIPGGAFCPLFLRGTLYIQCSIWVMQLALKDGRRKVSFLSPPGPSLSTDRTCSSRSTLRLSLSLPSSSGTPPGSRNRAGMLRPKAASKAAWASEFKGGTPFT